MEIEEVEKVKKQVELLFKECYFAKQQFILFEKLINDYNLESPYRPIIVAIVEALETSILIKMAKVYDNDKKEEAITLRYVLNTFFLEKQFNKDDEKIIECIKSDMKEIQSRKVKKLKILRNKYGAHLDRKYEEGMKSIHKKNKENQMYWKELKDIVSNTYEISKHCMQIIGKPIPKQDLTDKIEIQYEKIMKAIKQDEFRK